MPSRGRRSPTAGECKMVLVIRGEIRLTAGKAAVQAAHAAVILFQRASTRPGPVLAAWLGQGQKKIALTVPTLTELEALERAARGRGIPTVWVEDAGLTEVAPGTRTCLGLGPALSSELDPITGDLPLL
ncbi:MAG TPA: aminoacyl-tRNA hydrolase [Thermoplasmata archaeon]|nr:aminoacyl-tRNA hydrolase [Thermoplasmata archaeon]